MKTLNKISKDFELNLQIEQASYSDQISTLSDKSLTEFVKPAEERYNANGGITGWDYLYILDKSGKELTNKRKADLIKTLTEHEQAITNEYFIDYNKRNA